MSTTSYSDDVPAARATDGDQAFYDEASNAPSGAKEQAQQAAGTARDEGKRVAGVAKDEAQSVADEAKNQARGLLADATSQVEAQSKEQKTKLAETVRTFGDDLESMTSAGEGSDGIAGQLVGQVAEQAKILASHLEDREPRELLEDVRSFARRRPGTFLLGALAAGVVVGRLTRGAKDAKDANDESPDTSFDAAKRRASVPTSRSVTNEWLEQPATDPSLSSPVSAGPTELGAKGVEMSESGIVGPDGGRA
jgi:hypothetical protein